MDYDYTNIDTGAWGALAVVYVLLIIAIYVITAIGLWKMYAKAGKPGWAAIIPIYNIWVWVDIIDRPTWWFWVFLGSILLGWIPLVNLVLGLAAFVIYLLMCLDMAKCFGKGGGTGIGLWLVPFIFAPWLGFGDAQFVGREGTAPYVPYGTGGMEAAGGVPAAPAAPSRTGPIGALKPLPMPPPRGAAAGVAASAVAGAAAAALPDAPPAPPAPEAPPVPEAPAPEAPAEAAQAAGEGSAAAGDVADAAGEVAPDAPQE